MAHSCEKTRFGLIRQVGFVLRKLQILFALFALRDVPDKSCKKRPVPQFDGGDGQLYGKHVAVGTHRVDLDALS